MTDVQVKYFHMLDLYLSSYVHILNSTTLCYVMLRCVVLCCVVLCYVMLCYVMLCYVMLCYVMLCYVMAVAGSVSAIQ